MGYQVRSVHFHAACRIVAAVALVALCLQAGPTPLAAQTLTTQPPTLRITQIDTSNFPTVSAWVYGENLGGSLAATEMLLLESGAERAVTEEVKRAGNQVAFVFDASNNVRFPGITNAPRIQEVKDAIDRLSKASLFDDELDWLTFIALGDNAVPRVIGPELDAPWEDYDYQAIWNSVILYEPAQGAAITPLNDLIRFSVQQFGDPDLPRFQQRHIVVFSDGTDIVSVLESEQVVGLANDQNIRIHTVQLGNAGQGPERTLKQLSSLTGGSYVSLASPEAIDTVGDAIAATTEQKVLTYRSQLPTPGEVRVVASLPNNRTIEASASAPAVNVLPSSVFLLQPVEGSVVQRSGATWDSTLDSLAPASLPVQVAIQWPDGRARSVQRLEIEIGGKTTIVSSPPFDEVIEVPIPLLGMGDYTVRVRAIDELGLAGQSDPVRISVTEVRPPTPTPTVTPSPTPNATATAAAVARANAQATSEAKTQVKITEIVGSNEDLTRRLEQLSWATIASAALAIFALGFAIYVLSSRERRKRATEIVTGTLRSVTEPFMRSGRKGSVGGGSRAQLALVENGGTPSMPTTISLQGGSVRIGRDPAVASIVLDDRRISRFHCQIHEETGGYRILDEGSTSGTYVNDSEVGIHGQQLQNGDMVGIGPVVYRFEAMPGGGTAFAPGSAGKLDDPERTEILIAGRTPKR